ncbi:DMT family transporter [Prosthecomicrobium hirschii]|uniref:DMT family transporter n=1 Tax=Prosthecodimorpha hirschii TaxID=665126 RepID=UPI001FEE7983|nr:DMT family transporter [Prosthecomicrobium hirschii]MCW1840995.1 DMT family transporter [Prosthecomicrobium hirschii]
MKPPTDLPGTAEPVLAGRPAGPAADIEARRAQLARLKGIGLMCLALACFSVLDGAAKWLVRDMPALQVAFVRYTVALALIAAFLNPWTQADAWTTRRPFLQFVRGLLLFGSTIFNFIAVRTLQLADTMAIAFATPFLIALLSGPLLGERIGWKNWVAILIGFAGVLVITRPGTGGFQTAMLWSFGSVACYAAYGIATRTLSGIDSTASMLVISAAIPVGMLAPVMPAVWVWPPTTLDWALMLLLGLAGAVGHFFLIRAYTHAPAPVVAPFIYTQIVWAVLIGYLVFGDLPGLNTIVGASIVIGSGLYLIWRETGPSAGR